VAVWDVHAHLIPDEVIRAAERGRLGTSVSGGTLVCGSSRLPLAKLANPAALLARLEQNGVDGAVVSAPPALFRYDLPGADALRWAALLNEGMARTVADSGGRLRAFGYVPLASGPLAASTVAALGQDWCGYVIGTPPNGTTLAHRDLEPLWSAAAEELGFFFFHPGECPDERLDAFYLGNLLGNPYETSLAAAGLVFGDVIGRQPRLRFALAHGGGATAMLAGRWQRGYELRRPGIETLTLEPREALRRMLVDSIVHAPAALDLAASVFGAEHILLGSDWPFPMGGAEPVGELPPDLRQTISLAAARHVPNLPS
jgi:aminocarboxymuconate-semialdehyde decarboxylase